MREAMGSTLIVFREPGPFVETVRLDNERVSVPSANGVSQKPRVGFFRKRPAVGPDRAPRMPHLKKLKRPAGQLNEFEPIVVGEITGPTERITAHHGIL